MKQKQTRAIVIILITLTAAAALLLTACPTEPPGDDEGPETYTVTYDGNGAGSGAPPADGNAYEEGAEVTVLGNTGGLEKSGHTFTGWNNAADGSGGAYAEGDTFPMGAAEVTLYAVWTLNTVNVVSFQKISDTDGDFSGVLADEDNFGCELEALGDMNGDGAADIAVGAYMDDGGGAGRGAVWIVFMNSDGTVASEQKISDTDGGFGGTIDDYDVFGASITSIGDFNGDSVVDIAVGAYMDDDGSPSSDRGAVWVLFMNSNDTVSSHQKISDTDGGFTGILGDGDFFGFSLTSIGDLNGDMVNDLAVGAPYDDDGGTDRGAVWILFMNADGTVASHQKISDTEGSFTGELDNEDNFGSSVSVLGDINGDGLEDIVVGVPGDDDGGTGRGAVWILFMNADGTVASHQKISDTEGGFDGSLDNEDGFGLETEAIKDLNSDGVDDLVVSAVNDDDGGTDHGAVYILFLKDDGTVFSYQKISDTEGDFSGALDDNDSFGFSVTAPGDLDGNGYEDLVVGSQEDDDGGNNRGAVWVLFLDAAE